MIKYREEQTVTKRQNEKGIDKMYLNDLKDFEGFNKKVSMFSSIKLLPGEEVAYHVHTGEAESYYVVSGVGEYNDNGVISEVKSGMVTFTPSGYGHGIKNTGNEILNFVALIVLD